MKLLSLNVDDQGQSYFGTVESADKAGKERPMPIDYWQVWQTEPGHFTDFKPSDAPRCIAMMAGKLEITASNGERRCFARGDVFLFQDIRGRGHALRTIGFEPCSAVVVTMKDIMPEFAA
jgi:hypothetical protein